MPSFLPCGFGLRCHMRSIFDKNVGTCGSILDHFLTFFEISWMIPESSGNRPRIVPGSSGEHYGVFFLSIFPPSGGYFPPFGGSDFPYFPPYWALGPAAGWPLGKLHWSGPFLANPIWSVPFMANPIWTASFLANPNSVWLVPGQSQFGLARS